MDNRQEPDDEPSSQTTVEHQQIRSAWVEFLSDRLASWREWRFARRGARRAMDCRQRLIGQASGMGEREFYEAFVREYSGLDIPAARTVLRRAEASFAAWPNERDLIFRDIVQFLAISEYLASHPKRSGTTANMTIVISRIIPKNL